MQNDFKHLFIQGDLRFPVLLLLHGTGGDEQDLIGTAKNIAPGFSILSLRGKVLENGMPRFFKRLSEGVFDLEDLRYRTNELAEFLTKAREVYDFAGQPVIALGYSNGANIAASLLLSHSHSLQGAILLRAMLPFKPDKLPELNGKKILMLSGMLDSIIPAENPGRLAEILESSGASIDHRINLAGHGLTQPDFTDMKSWIEKNYSFVRG